MITRFLIVGLIAIIGVGCDRLPGGPSKVDLDWPGGDSWGEKPVPVNQTVTVSSPSGSVIIFLEKMTPHEGGTAHVGQKAQIWARVTNNSEKFLAIRSMVSNGSGDRPGELGDPSNLFDPNSMWTFKPGEARDVIFGFDVRQPEEVSWLRLAGNYETKTHPTGGFPLFQIGPWTRPEWTQDIHLGWSLVP